MIQKRCTKCGEDKDLTAFHAHPNGKYGRTNHCKDCKAEYARQLYAKNRDKRLEGMKAWRKANPERKRELDRKWRASWDEKKRAAESAARRRRREANLEREYEWGRQWYLANKERAHAYASMYRARRRGSTGSHTAEDWLRMCRIWDHRCAYCGIRPETLTKDHVVPLSRGGTDYIGNIVPACHPCNSGKCDRTVTEWRAGIPAMRFRLAT